jgi:hypothetical protein
VVERQRPGAQDRVNFVRPVPKTCYAR